MIDVNRLNSHIKYDLFFKMSKEQWNLFNFYKNLSSEYYNNYQWLYTFKDYINWPRLLASHNIKLKHLKCFTNYYDDLCWNVISRYYKLTPQFINKFHKHLNIQDVFIYSKFTKQKMKKLNSIIFK